MPELLEKRTTRTAPRPSAQNGRRKQPSAPRKQAIRRERSLPQCHAVPCDACGSEKFSPLFVKASSQGEVFRLVSCSGCGLVQVNPQPNLAAVEPYYSNHYFTQRTDRGYDDYFSSGVRTSILDTYHRNLKDLDFYLYETRLWEQSVAPRSLDAGCAAGYFVAYLAERGWDSRGIELSKDAARYGRDVLGLPIQIGDYLSSQQLEPGSFDLVTLWASLEHMHSPRAVLERTFRLLKPGGRMLLSTCRFGLLARALGKRWRYMNVPEHLYFFSIAGLERLAGEVGFRTVKTITYGSGLTTKPQASLLYRWAKRIADPLVKRTHQGDMMALHLEKI